jgi:hypothetical protein
MARSPKHLHFSKIMLQLTLQKVLRLYWIILGLSPCYGLEIQQTWALLRMPGQLCSNDLRSVTFVTLSSLNNNCSWSGRHLSLILSGHWSTVCQIGCRLWWKLGGVQFNTDFDGLSKSNADSAGWLVHATNLSTLIDWIWFMHCTISIYYNEYHIFLLYAKYFNCYVLGVPFTVSLII